MIIALVNVNLPGDALWSVCNSAGVGLATCYGGGTAPPAVGTCTCHNPDPNGYNYVPDERNIPPMNCWILNVDMMEKPFCPSTTASVPVVVQPVTTLAAANIRNKCIRTVKANAFGCTCPVNADHSLYVPSSCIMHACIQHDFCFCFVTSLRDDFRQAPSS